MGILRKLRQFVSCRVRRHVIDSPTNVQSRQSIRDQTRSSTSASANVIYDPLSQSFLRAVNSEREHSDYDHLSTFDRRHMTMADASSEHDKHRNGFFRNSSNIIDRTHDRIVRPHSSEQMKSTKETPIKYRRRPISSERMQARALSPSPSSINHVQSQSRSSSSEAFAQFRQAQEYDNMIRQQQMMSMPYFTPVLAQYQPSVYPIVTTPGWFTIPSMQQSSIHLFY
jgi:hypothetical protein